MKNYLLKKEILFKELPVKKIIYDFLPKQTNKPTSWKHIIIHHTKNRKTIQQVIQNHVIERKFSEIGYHFLIGKRGQIYYARELSKAGAHTYHYNQNSIGIGLFGNLDETKPTENQLISLQSLISTLTKQFPITQILGHNQAAFEKLSGKYFKLNLPKNLLLNSFSSKKEFELFKNEFQEKIISSEEYDEIQRSRDSQKFKSCPGYFMFKEVERIKKMFKL